MGGKCCTDRKTGEPASGPAKGDRKSVYAGNAYEPKKKAISIGYHTAGDDAEKFDKAFEKNDLDAFVKLLASTQKVEPFDERMHPWAEDPKTVGALAGTQLAILASAAENDGSNMKEKIREAGAIKPLVNFLKSDENDRVQTAVVAFSFITDNCPEAATEAHEAGVMPLLLKHLDSKIPGMRAAAAMSLRNICMEDESYKKEFITLGGMKGLVFQLAASSNVGTNVSDAQLEAVLNLQDLVENDQGRLVQEYAQAAIEAGAMDELKKLMKAEDDEVRQAVEEVLESLASVAK
eukprot:TRINITY_DN8604_c0_g1_i1.p1 TRINITY_DN8604_c0_g1~~TRINITY_DN8604_c0_g1_i1.p1  ORF type:complete len:292 (+),score=95.43 TRINITY_DN8604_c0_g1_i1:53-928(+)